MPLTRRDTLGLAAATLAATLIRTPRAAAAAKIEVVAFDAFPVFDPRPIFALVDKLVPDRGKELGDLWRTRQFEYTWLRTAAGQYEDFWKVTTRSKAQAFASPFSRTSHPRCCRRASKAQVLTDISSRS